MIAEAYQGEPDHGLSRILAVRKVFRLDMALALDFYFYRMTSELNEKIQELDDFTQAVSHDLKEPLRGIEAFTGFLLKDYSDRLNGQGKHYLKFLKDSAARMKMLIHDLLTLVSISRKGLTLQTVDLDEALVDVQHDLEDLIQRKKAEIRTLSPLPVVHCDRVLIEEVFRNLLSNAIKFNTSDPPHVEITARKEGSFHLFSVKDNGIGIDPRYKEKIFGLFERLHKQEEIEGTGIGLANCKKVIERLGGRIWVESCPGEGSTFLFTLPKKS